VEGYGDKSLPLGYKVKTKEVWKGFTIKICILFKLAFYTEQHFFNNSQHLNPVSATNNNIINSKM